MKKTPQIPKREEVLSKEWWKVPDVAGYLGYTNIATARNWMARARVRRSPVNHRLTCKAWVDARLEHGKGGAK